MANGCFPVQSGIEFTCKPVLVGIGLNRNLNVKPALADAFHLGRLSDGGAVGRMVNLREYELLQPGYRL
jgi:hypothetical protein